MKRKHSASTSPEDSDADYPPSRASSPPSAKRRRCSTLERGLANLVLDFNATQPISILELPNPVQPTSNASTPSAMDISPYPTPTPSPSPAIIYPSSVEEYSPSDHEIKMKSWYEPEKDRKSTPAHTDLPRSFVSSLSGIVVTDLDSSDSEVDDDENSGNDITISPALLERFKSRPLRGPEPLIGGTRLPDESKALVLFKPLIVGPFPTQGIVEEPLDEERESTSGSETETEMDSTAMSVSTTPYAYSDEDDAMDVDMES